MPKRDRKARRDARRLEQELIVSRAELAREQGNGRELAAARDRIRTLESLVQDANAAIARMSTHAFKLHIGPGMGRGLMDESCFQFSMSLDRRMLDELAMEGREFLVQRLAWQIMGEMEKAAHSADRERQLLRPGDIPEIAYRVPPGIGR